MKRLILIVCLMLVASGLVWPTHAQSSVYFEKVDQALPNLTNSVSLADLNGDGTVDVFITSSYSYNRRFNYELNGVFHWRNYILGDGAKDTALGDLDGDGLPDFFGAKERSLNQTGQNEVWLSSLSRYGVPTDSGQRLGEANSQGVALGDLDGDGDLDAFVVNSHFRATGQPAIDYRNTVWFNDGHGIFSDSGQRLGDGFSKAVALADVDGDGDLDAYVGNYRNRPQDVLWLNDGHGGFTDSGQDFGFEWTSDVDFGDVDGDGDQDFVVGVFNGDTTILRLNDGHGTFSDSGQVFGSGYTAALADLDGDDDLDLLLSVTFSDNQVWLNDGQGSFSDSGQRLGDKPATDIALGDLDNDGDLDVYLASRSFGEVWLNKTLPVFEAKSTIYLPLVIK